MTVRCAPAGLIIDNFAGGGGASLGIEAAMGRKVDIAINHDPEAVAMHQANHPRTHHHCQSVWKADPRDVTGGNRVALAWFSPDCKHFSKAKGGKPVEKGIRDLAWVVVHWAKLVRPAVIMLENVEEFRDWGPLITTTDGRTIPCPDRKGFTFRKWVRELKKLGYQVEHRELRASEYGTPTIRKRLFLIARCDGLPIVWPTTTHGPGKLPFRTAAECIDWSIPCPSIFERKKALANATMRRIARGVKRYVIDAWKPYIVQVGIVDNYAPDDAPVVDPFLVPVTHQGDDRVHSAHEPMRTITTARRGELALVTPYMVRTAHGEQDKTGKKRGRGEHAVQEPLPTVTASRDFALVAPILAGVGGRAGQSRERSGDEPLGTITSKYDTALVAAHVTKFRAGSTGHGMDEPMHTVTANSFIKRPGGAAPVGVVAAFMAQHNSERDGRPKAGRPIYAPVSTVTSTGGQQGLIAAHLSHQYSSGPGEGDPTKPMRAVTAQGQHAALVYSFMVKYYGTAIGQEIDAPLHSVTSKDRFGVVTVNVNGQVYAITDIGMRMLTPRELFRAQGFPDSYIINPVYNGKPLTKTAQIRMCGNSVCPPLAEALVRANLVNAVAAEVA